MQSARSFRAAFEEMLTLYALKNYGFSLEK
jgi:hypothetical protein